MTRQQTLCYTGESMLNEIVRIGFLLGVWTLLSTCQEAVEYAYGSGI